MIRKMGKINLLAKSMIIQGRERVSEEEKEDDFRDLSSRDLAGAMLW